MIYSWNGKFNFDVMKIFNASYFHCVLIEKTDHRNTCQSCFFLGFFSVGIRIMVIRRITKSIPNSNESHLKERFQYTLIATNTTMPRRINKEGNAHLTKKRSAFLFMSLIRIALFLLLVFFIVYFFLMICIFCEKSMSLIRALRLLSLFFWCDRFSMHRGFWRRWWRYLSWPRIQFWWIHRAVRKAKRLQKIWHQAYCICCLSHPKYNHKFTYLPLYCLGWFDRWAVSCRYSIFLGILVIRYLVV